jgi:hypothetical protein
VNKNIITSFFNSYQSPLSSKKIIDLSSHLNINNYTTHHSSSDSSDSETSSQETCVDTVIDSCSTNIKPTSESNLTLEKAKTKLSSTKTIDSSNEKTPFKELPKSRSNTEKQKDGTDKEGKRYHSKYECFFTNRRYPTHSKVLFNVFIFYVILFISIFIYYLKKKVTQLKKVLVVFDLSLKNSSYHNSCAVLPKRKKK